MTTKNISKTKQTKATNADADISAPTVTDLVTAAAVPNPTPPQKHIGTYDVDTNGRIPVERQGRFYRLSVQLMRGENREKNAAANVIHQAIWAKLRLTMPTNPARPFEHRLHTIFEEVMLAKESGQFNNNLDSYIDRRHIVRHAPVTYGKTRTSTPPAKTEDFHLPIVKVPTLDIPADIIIVSASYLRLLGVPISKKALSEMGFRGLGQVPINRVRYSLLIVPNRTIPDPITQLWIRQQAFAQGLRWIDPETIDATTVNPTTETETETETE